MSVDSMHVLAVSHHQEHGKADWPQDLQAFENHRATQILGPGDLLALAEEGDLRSFDAQGKSG